MKNIEKILPTAIEAVKKEVLNGEKVPKEFNGYISSFGASMISSGLLPTLVFFSQEGKGKGNRTSVITAIEYILHKEYSALLPNDKKLVKKVEEMVSAGTDMQRLQEKIQLAAIALKLAIRIFPKSKEESNHE